MSTATLPLAAKEVKGGSFLLEETRAEDVFTPEDFSEEQIHIAKTADSFSKYEVLPAAKDIEAKNFAVTRHLLREAGHLGLLAVDIPEAYGGLEMDKVTSALVSESLNQNASFSVTVAAHTGIGTLPIVWYGTESQKKKYLPKLATGEYVSACALSEASSGSDAMNLRTRAVLSDDGRHYILNGEKMWISNCGLADLYTVFAKIDGEKLSAFLVERNTPGLAIGPEEHKLGIRGSSTCPLILDDCHVPVQNLLGEPGKGDRIAFTILNIGRLKLGATCIGAARTALRHAAEYASQRKAFGKSIVEFGLIREKLAECATRIYAAESLTYRTAGMIDAALSGLDQHAPGASARIQMQLEQYAAECSIVKVCASEMLDTVVDHVVQIYGGCGYVEDYPAAAAYRDARINRIFEGTNEINRLIVTGSLLKRAMTGQLPLLPAMKAIMNASAGSQPMPEDVGGPLARERRTLANMKKLTLFAAGIACRKHMHDMQDQQEIMGALADSIIEVYVLESCILRAEKLFAIGNERSAENAITLTRLYATKAVDTVEACAKKVIAAVATGDMLRTHMETLRTFLNHEPVDTIALTRQIARHIVDAGRYIV